MMGRKRQYRQYSDEEKAAALIALDGNGGNLIRTARDTGIPRTTLRHWLAGEGTPSSVAEIGQGTRAPLAERLERMAHDLVDVVPEKTATAPLREVAIALAIAVDKARLLRELPTERVAHDFSDEEREARLARFLERGGEGGTRPVPAPSVTLQ
jgi:transposase-like protein